MINYIFYTNHQVTEAYYILINPNLRNEYNKYLNNEFNSFNSNFDKKIQIKYEKNYNSNKRRKWKCN